MILADEVYGSAARRLVAALDLADDRAARNGLPDLGGECGDDAVLVRVERLFHLHGLEDDDELAGSDLLTFLDRDLDDRALHRAGQRVTTRYRLGLAATRATRRPLRRRTGRPGAEAGR